MKRDRIIIACVAVLCFAALAAFYAIYYSSHLLWQEQNRIFLYSASWIAGYFGRPAWLACLGGEWLSQFFAFPLAGAVILTLLIAAATVLFGIAARRYLRSWAALALSAVFALFLAGCSMRASTAPEFFIAVAGGLLCGVAPTRVTVRNGRRIDLAPLAVAFSFWAFGFGALVTALLKCADAVGRGYEEKWRGYWWVSAVCTAAVAVGLPAAVCRPCGLPYGITLTYPGLSWPGLPESRSEERLAIADAFSSGDYARTGALAQSVEEPDDVTAFYYYLSSAVRDSLPDNLMKYPVKNLGTLTSIGDETPLMVINMMNDLYFELGDMTYAERAAMMRNVFSPRNRNVRMMRRLAEINLVSGDTAAAMKYLRILDRTHFYSGWSRDHRPGSMSGAAEEEILRRRDLSNSKDNIRLGDNCRNILLELLESNPRNTVALDYLLCTDLLLKDMDTFKMDYDTYCMEKGAPRYKDLYQQALMIYLAGTEAPGDEWERYIVPGPQAQAFRAYSARRGDPAFSDTYWYYFDRHK
ncbi:MAG: hypothetical protein K2K93_02955 [Muribaculaceae bacterium]|nr:hypothetical protein [Muribaculaceae bacterium]